MRSSVYINLDKFNVEKSIHFNNEGNQLPEQHINDHNGFALITED